MKKFILFVLCVVLVFTACTQPDYDNTEAVVISGDDLQDMINNAEPGATIKLERATYSLSKPLMIDKPLTIIGQGQGKTIIDYGSKLMDYDDYPDLIKNAWLGGVNVYSDGVTIQGLTITGDLDKARERGPIASDYYTEKTETEKSRVEYYKPVFGLYINPLVDATDTTPEELSTTDGILISDVEITKTTRDAVYAVYGRVKDAWYSGKNVDMGEVNDDKAKGITLTGLNIHDNGDIKATHCFANGVFLRNSTNIVLEDSKIDTGDSGAPIWIHASMYKGPYIVKNCDLKGKYLDSEDYCFAYYSIEDIGKFDSIEAPVVIELNDRGGEEPYTGKKSLTYCIIAKSSFLNTEENAPIQIENYSLNGDYTIDFDTVAYRKPRWANYVIAIGANS